MKEMTEKYSLGSTSDYISTVAKPKIQCLQSNPIVKICLNPQCSSALMCEKQDCKSCGLDVHNICHTVSFTILTNLINDPINEYKQFVQSIEQIEEALIKQIQSKRKILTEKYPLGNILPKFQNIIDEIYKKKNEKGLSGKQAKQFYKYMLVEKKKENIVLSALLKHYNQNTMKITEEFLELQEYLFEKYAKKQSVLSSRVEEQEKRQFQRLKNFIQTVNIEEEQQQKLFSGRLADLVKDMEQKDEKFPLPKLVAELVVQESSILKTLTLEQKVFLHNSLQYPKKRFKLLFRASEHAFDTGEFHRHCDDIEDTLTVVRTQFNRTIVGFTHYKWNQVNSDWVKNSDRNAFLLHLDLYQKFVPNDDKHLIFCSIRFGPRFGNDLVIGQHCDQQLSSYSKFPCHYNLEAPNRYTKRRKV